MAAGPNTTDCILLQRIVGDGGAPYWHQYFVPLAAADELLPAGFLDALQSYGYGGIENEPKIVIDTLEALDQDPRVVRVEFVDGAYRMRHGGEADAVCDDSRTPFPAGWRVVDAHTATLIDNY